MDQPVLLAFLGVMLVHLAGAISPGPAFVFVARTSVAVSRRAGVFAALGMGVGAVFWAGLTMLGWAVVVREAAWLHATLRVAGGLYLLWIGVSLWRKGREPAADSDMGVSRGDRQAFRLALLAQLSNPKIMMFFASVFVAVLPTDPPAWFAGAVLATILLNETAWYVFVARAFSSGFSRRAYGGLKLYIDRIAGGVLAAMGLGFIVSAR